MFVVALATLAGAEVTAVDRAAKGDFLREIGADRTIDFATEDWADERDSVDLVVDLVAHRSPGRGSACWSSPSRVPTSRR